MLKRLTYPIFLGAALLAGCGGGGNPVPLNMDLPEDMDPRLKEFFTICPVAMTSTQGAIKLAVEREWEEQAVGIKQPSWTDTYMFEKQNQQLSFWISHSKDSATLVCQISLDNGSAFSADISDNEPLPDFQVINSLGFTGGYEVLDEIGYGEWSIGSYPYDARVTVNAQEGGLGYINMIWVAPKSSEVYNR